MHVLPVRSLPLLHVLDLVLDIHSLDSSCGCACYVRWIVCQAIQMLASDATVCLQHTLEPKQPAAAQEAPAESTAAAAREPSEQLAEASRAKKEPLRAEEPLAA